MKFKEIETKYKADNVSLSDFQALCKDPVEIVLASGFDYFYYNIQEPTAFGRYRKGADTSQITVKRKTSSSNNYVRGEINLNIKDNVDLGTVTALFETFGYQYTNCLYKSCFIYKYPLHTFVYYICYNKDMKELGRYIEVEMSEEHDWSSETAAWESLLELESKLKPLGIVPQSRVKRSLFEMYGNP